ncbi:GNAT family N-acetyltransferase [Bacteroides heparinolyticus]|uniref:GNAT family N-acetyltransferase n=1 Tax=Prevotella heparinolytica TaxID=28113 RepID=UPI003AEFE2E3
MIRLQRITTADTTLYHYMERLMIASFPPEEYREPEEQRKNTDTQTAFHSNIIFQDNEPIGFITYWDFEQFYYIEHFAISPEHRNEGHGKNVLKHLCRQLEHPIVLEAEMPKEEIAQRRILFYQRNGFSLWEKPYQQPPYKAGDSYLPMRLMVHGDMRCSNSFDIVKERIYREVYNIKQ